MMNLIDLPAEIIENVLQCTHTSDLTSVSLVCRSLYKASLSLRYKDFRSSQNSEQTLERLRSFGEILRKDEYSELGKHVKSISTIGTYDPIESEHLRNLLVPLLSWTPNIQQLAITGHSQLLDQLKNVSEKNQAFLRQLQELHCEGYAPGIWDLLEYLTKLPQLSLINHPVDPILLHLPGRHFMIKRIVLQRSYLDTHAVCAIIRGCESLESFQYLSPRTSCVINAHQIYEACVPHKNSLKELVVQNSSRELVVAYSLRDVFSQISLGGRNDATPKFGSFGDFLALERLGVDLDTLSPDVPLPPSLSSIAIRNADVMHAAVLVHVCNHPPLKCVQLYEEEIALVLQLRQMTGHVPGDLEIHVLHD